MQFPLVIQRREEDAIVNFVESNRLDMKEKLDTFGSILLRGWTVSNADVFHEVSRALGVLLLETNCSAGPRIEVRPGVNTSNEAPASEEIPFHHEMAQCVSPPKYVLFHCQIAPKVRGSTPIIHSWKLVRELDEKFPDVAAKIRTKQIRYVREYPSDLKCISFRKSWKETFSAHEKRI